MKFIICQILSLGLIQMIFWGTLKAQDSSFTVYEHIALTQNLSVSAHRLCQDGLYIYFKTKKDCINSRGPFVCENDLKIAPIRSVEKIYLEVGGQSLTRFYEIDLSFKQRTYFSSEGSEDELKEERVEKIGFCPNVTIYKPANVGSWRYVETHEEAHIIETFISAEIDLINTPYGGLQFFKNIIAAPSAKDPFFEELPRFKSPYCNNELSPDVIKEMSGEFSGNGIMSFQINQLQDLSREIFIKEIKADFNLEGHKQRTQYQLSCQDVKEI